MTGTDSRWPLPLVRAMLGSAILACLCDQELHGYALTQQLSNRGFGTLKGGSLYPALRSLDEAGLVVSGWETQASGPAKKVYAITAAGRAHLVQSQHELQDLLAALSPQSEVV